jgi:hypothetical protein
MTSAWAGWRRFNIPVDRYGGVHSLLICTSSTVYWGLLPATRLASREILIEQNIKKWTGPALWLLCGIYIADHIQGLYTVYNGAGVHSTVAVLGLTTNEGRRQPPQGSSPCIERAQIGCCLNKFFCYLNFRRCLCYSPFEGINPSTAQF